MEQEMQHLLERIISLKEDMMLNQDNLCLRREYNEALEQFNCTYESYLEDKLYDIYDEYFEDDAVESILSYLSEDGVLVYGEDFPGVRGTLHMYMNPLRLEFVSQSEEYHTCLWNAA